MLEEGNNLLIAVIINASNAPLSPASDVNIKLDINAPSVNIASVSRNSGDTVGTRTLSYTATFNEIVTGFDEIVTGFDVNDIRVSGTAGASFATDFVATSDSKTFSFDVIAHNDGGVTVFIGNNAAQDLADNGNTASNMHTLTIDTDTPGVSITSVSRNSGDTVGTRTLSYTATFDEIVAGFDVNDIRVTGTVNGGSATVVDGFFATNSRTFSFNISGNSDRTVMVSIDAGVAQDIAGNGNTVSNIHTLTIDTAAPTVTITSVSSTDSFTVKDIQLHYTATFNEAVKNFVVNDITVAGSAGVATAINFVANADSRTFTFDVVKENSDGSVTVFIATNAAQDLAGNGNTESNIYTLTIDSTAPIVSITTPIERTVYTSSFTVRGTAEADSTVELFRATGSGSDTVSLGVTTATNGTWKIPVTLEEGVNTFTAKATDAIGNISFASNPLTITYKPGLSPQSAKQLNEAILPQLVQSMLASTMAAVNSRIDATFSGIPQVASYQLDGSTNLQDAMMIKPPHYAKSLKDGTMDWKEMLSRSSFALPLNAVDGAERRYYGLERNVVSFILCIAAECGGR